MIMQSSPRPTALLPWSRVRVRRWPSHVSNPQSQERNQSRWTSSPIPTASEWLGIDLHLENDTRGFLVSATGPGDSVALRVPDEVGNLYGSLRHFDAAGALTTEHTPSGSRTYRHDPEGQLVEHEEPRGEEVRYGWDGTGRQAIVERADGTTVVFEYDALARRVSKTVGDEASRWRWDGNNLLHDWIWEAIQ